MWIRLSTYDKLRTEEKQGIGAEAVFLDDIVQQVYGENRRQQQQSYREHPSQFLTGLSRAIRVKIFDCKGKVPVLTGMTLLLSKWPVLTLYKDSSARCHTL
jgi:hypothetical protein